MKVIEPKLSSSALAVFKKRYARTDMKGRVLETPGEMLWRVAKFMAKAEIVWDGNNGLVEKIAEEFFERMVKFKFVCSGKAMFEAGNPGGSGQLSACFVLGIKDSIKDIFKTLGEAALIHKNNGGTGFNFSQIRPTKDKVRNVPGAASGPVDFIKAYDACLGAILQGGKRHGGNMAILNASHPDIFEFVAMKNADGRVKNFNISVGASNEFMQAVAIGEIWSLVNPRDGLTVRRLPARTLFNEIVANAHRLGDPGMIFLDRLEQDNPTPSLGDLSATNPCGEQPLLPYESCNLASIVLSNHLKKNGAGRMVIDWQDLGKTIAAAVRFLDNMIEVNNYILPQTERIVKEGNRKIGLGVMGLAHLFYQLAVAYNSAEAVRLSERLAKFIKKEAETASLALAKTRGVFPNFDLSYYRGTAKRYRNATMLTIAPTGTISLLADCSSGIEPVFSLVTERRTFFEDDKKNRPTRQIRIVDPVFQYQISNISKACFLASSKIKYQKYKANIKNMVKLVAEHGGSLQKIEAMPNELKKLLVTSHEIESEWHVRIQAAWQKYFDNAVSKTINFHASASVDEVKKAYLLAWQLGCKGITIYRDQSKKDQVLQNPKSCLPAGMAKIPAWPAGRQNPKNNMNCPSCGSGLQMADGCRYCVGCGYSDCLI